MSALVLIACAAAPWLTVLPLGGIAAVLARVLTFVAALHGAGRLLAWCTGRSVSPLLAMQWGAAGMIGVSGIALALHADRAVFQVVLVLALALVHTAWIGLAFSALRARLAAVLADTRWWLAPALLLAAIGAIQVLGAAGALGAHPFDDDGNVLAQVQRLRDTGALGDAIGYPRVAQLGGQVALTSLASIPGDVHLVRVLEALAMLLAVALAAGRMQLRDAHAVLWALLAVIAASALSYVAADPSAWWTAIGLVVALHAMLAEEDPPAVPTGIVAGALMTLHHEMIPIALAAMVFAWRRGPRKRMVAMLAAALAVTVPFVIARAAAWSGVGSAHALLAPAHGGVLAKLAIAAGVTLACAPIMLWATGPMRWLGVGASLALAGIASQLTGARPYATHFVWPIAIAAGLIWIAELVRARAVRTTALIAALALCVLIYDGRAATGSRRWARRYLDLAANIEYLRTTGGDAPVLGGYETVLASAPRGARVALWVERPERLRYDAGLDLVDLRTPRAAHLRVHRWDAHRSQLADLVAASGARYLLLEADDHAYQRMLDSPMYRFVCATHARACDDDLEAIAADHAVIAAAGGIRLVDLTTSSGPR